MWRSGPLSLFRTGVRPASCLAWPPLPWPLSPSRGRRDSRLDRLQVVVELIHQRHPGRDVELEDVASQTLSRYFTSARRLLPCAAMTTRLPALDGGRDDLVPERQEARHGVLQALRERQVLFRQVCVAPVVAGEALVIGSERGRRDVVAAAPDLHLVLAELGRRLGLVEPLQARRSGARSGATIAAPGSTSDPSRRGPY